MPTRLHRSLTISVIPFEDEHESPHSPGGWDDLHDMIHDYGDALPKLIAECISYTTTLQALSLNLRGLDPMQNTEMLNLLSDMGDHHIKNLRLRTLRVLPIYQEDCFAYPGNLFERWPIHSLQTLQVNYNINCLWQLYNRQNQLRSLSIVLDDDVGELLDMEKKNRDLICAFALMIRLVCCHFPSLEALVLQDYTDRLRGRLPLVSLLLRGQFALLTFMRSV